MAEPGDQPDQLAGALARGPGTRTHAIGARASRVRDAVRHARPPGCPRRRGSLAEPGDQPDQLAGALARGPGTRTHAIGARAQTTCSMQSQNPIRSDMAEKEQDKFIENRSVNEDFLAFLDIFIGQMTAVKLLMDFVYMSGYDLGKMDKPNSQGVTAFDKLLVVSDSVRNTYEDFREKWPSWKSWKDVRTGLQFLLNVMTEINKCREVFKLAGEENDFDVDEDALLLHVTEQVVLRTHAILFPPAIQLYRLLNWVKIGTENENNDSNIEKDTTGRIIRYPYRGIAFNKDGINEFFRDPAAALKKQYFDKSAPRAIGPLPDDILLTRLRDFLLSCNLSADYGYRVSDAVTIDSTTADRSVNYPKP